MNAIRIGISGWTYPLWRGVFFPKGWPQKRELEYASRQVGAIEINGTFYSLERPESYRAWYDTTPDGFVFSLKGGRFITHLKRLRGVETPLANFFGSGIFASREKLGPILWQSPSILSYCARFFNEANRANYAGHQYHTDSLLGFRLGAVALG